MDVLRQNRILAASDIGINWSINASWFFAVRRSFYARPEAEEFRENLRSTMESS
ncbi:MAG: hypothetical protein IT428_09795 [Planctomycetaceae bacterium]|nr:hypothetical protein [Planctomycetaceae bacterium]